MQIYVKKSFQEWHLVCALVSLLSATLRKVWPKFAYCVCVGKLLPGHQGNLVDPASSHMLVSKIKPCMSKYKSLYGETANGSLKQLSSP